ncbi:MAG: glycerophosphodiester phosphodiesterase family protein [Acidimicrobiales bacterium]
MGAPAGRPGGKTREMAIGLRVSTWTVDEPRHMARVTRAGVDAIVSNRLAELQRFLAGTTPGDARPGAHATEPPP